MLRQTQNAGPDEVVDFPEVPSSATEEFERMLQYFGMEELAKPHSPQRWNKHDKDDIVIIESPADCGVSNKPTPGQNHLVRAVYPYSEGIHYFEVTTTLRDG